MPPRNSGEERPGRLPGDLSPFQELEEIDRRVKQAAEEERRTHWDDSVPPKPHRASDPDEPVTDDKGRERDLMRDTPELR